MLSIYQNKFFEGPREARHTSHLWLWFAPIIPTTIQFFNGWPLVGRGIWPSTYLHAWNIVDSSFVVFGGDVFRVEAPIPNTSKTLH